MQSFIIAHLWQSRRALQIQEAAAATLAASEQHFRLLAEVSQDVIFRYDLLPTPRIVYLSPAVEAMTGFTAEEFYADQTLWQSLLTEEDRVRLFENMVDPMRAQEPIEARWWRKDGSEYWAEARFVPIFDDEGQCVTVIGTNRDISERHQIYEELYKLSRTVELERAVAEQTHELRKANARLQELDRLKSKFVSDVSHELRTPVTNIVLYLKLFERRPEKQAHYLQILQDETARLETLVLDILDLVQLDNKPALSLSPINLNELLQGVVDAQRASAENRNLELTLDTYADLPVIMGDSDKLTQVATNLVANALYYTSNGYVRIRTAKPDTNTVSFTVEDSGIGIYAEDLPHLFERFYRGRRDQIAEVPGTGLGLSIVEEVVSMHNGTLHIDSEVGRGTTFTVSLPRALRGTQVINHTIHEAIVDHADNSCHRR